jgi:hypothetical protein
MGAIIDSELTNYGELDGRIYGISTSEIETSAGYLARNWNCSSANSELAAGGARFLTSNLADTCKTAYYIPNTKVPGSSSLVVQVSDTAMSSSFSTDSENLPKLPIFVKDYKDAVPCEEKVSELYCLNTTSHKITVLSGNGPLEFADWEELGDDSMLSWDEYVRNFLNNASSKVAVKNSVLESESGFDISSLVTTKTGTIEIYKVGLGDIIFDGEDWTKIVGSVYIDGDHTEIMGRINSCKLSGASWIYENKKWIRASESKQWKVEVPVKRLISLFTESGKFMVDGVVVRDFSDVGIHNINKTYDFTLSRLLQKCSLLNR